ncbi:MAG: hypothetical protein ACOXZ6_09360 [Syntrophomonadaceae bacterium]|nr:hypothetical protein [Bacillota bacterium]
MKPAWLCVGIGVCACYILLVDLSYDIIEAFLDWLLYFPFDSWYLIMFLYCLSFLTAYVLISLLVLTSSKRLLAYIGVVILNGLFLYFTALLAASRDGDLWIYLGILFRIPIASLLLTIILLVMLGVTSYLRRKESPAE